MSYIGGICQNNVPVKLKHSNNPWGYLNLNTGFVTFHGHSPGRQETIRPLLTLAHEVGHNLGAQHDGTKNKCDPKKFMMANVSSNLPKEQPKLFSQCSKKYFKAEMEEIEEV